MDLELIPDAILEDLKAYTDIKHDSPVRKDKKVVYVHGVTKPNYQPGSYKKGWMIYTKSYERGHTQGYVRNKTNYQLTHLLELGHKAMDGSWVEPIPHIVDNQNEARKKLDEMIEEILEE